MGEGSSSGALGRAVAELRRRSGRSQAELARAAGLHRTYIAGVERGARNPTWDTLGTLAAGLGVSLSELVALAEELDDD